MEKIWAIADLHLNHKNMFLTDKFADCSRRLHFKNVDEMNATIIKNCNSVVKDEDKFYILGDIYFGNKMEASNLLSQLKGRKRLILGNHDDGKSHVLFEHFEKILVSRVFRQYSLMLTHIPVHPYSLTKGRCDRNVHGHIHDHKIDDPRYVNISVEQTSYFPVDLATL